MPHTCAKTEVRAADGYHYKHAYKGARILDVQHTVNSDKAESVQGEKEYAAPSRHAQVQLKLLAMMRF